MPWKDLYPFESNYHLIDSNRMHYVRQGDGPTVLMVHGNPTWSFFWREVIKNFSTEFDCLAIDHIGMGLSDKPQDYTYTLQQHSDNLCNLIDSLDLKDVRLIVHDWGGAIGLRAATIMPDRIAKITITNTAAFPPPYVPFRIAVCRWPIVGPWMMRGLNVFPKAAIRQATEQSKLESSVAKGFLHPYGNWHDRIALNAFVRDIPVTSKHPCWSVLEKLEQDLAALKSKPIQLIWGMKDWCFRPSCLERFESIFPNADVCRIEHAGHYLIEDAQDEVLDALTKFLP